MLIQSHIVTASWLQNFPRVWNHAPVGDARKEITWKQFWNTLGRNSRNIIVLGAPPFKINDISLRIQNGKKTSTFYLHLHGNVLQSVHIGHSDIVVNKRK